MDVATSSVDDPPTFRHLAFEPTFAAWGWQVALDRPCLEPARLDVTPDGFTLTGTGRGTVVTPPTFVPGSTVRTPRRWRHLGPRRRRRRPCLDPGRPRPAEHRRCRRPRRRPPTSSRPGRRRDPHQRRWADRRPALDTHPYRMAVACARRPLVTGAADRGVGGGGRAGTGEATVAGHEHIEASASASPATTDGDRRGDRRAGRPGAGRVRVGDRGPGQRRPGDGRAAGAARLRGGCATPPAPTRPPCARLGRPSPPPTPPRPTTRRPRSPCTSWWARPPSIPTIDHVGQPQRRRGATRSGPAWDERSRPGRPTLGRHRRRRGRVRRRPPLPHGRPARRADRPGHRPVRHRAAPQHPDPGHQRTEVRTGHRLPGHVRGPAARPLPPARHRGRRPADHRADPRRRVRRRQPVEQRTAWRSRGR